MERPAISSTGFRNAFVLILVLAVSAGAPLLPRKVSGIGDSAYIFSLVVTSSLVAIVVVPAWIAALSPYFQPSASLSPMDVAWIVGKSFLLPLAIGLILHRAAPAISGTHSSSTEKSNAMVMP